MESCNETQLPTTSPPRTGAAPAKHLCRGEDLGAASSYLSIAFGQQRRAPRDRQAWARRTNAHRPRALLASLLSFPWDHAESGEANSSPEVPPNSGFLGTPPPLGCEHLQRLQPSLVLLLALFFSSLKIRVGREDPLNGAGKNSGTLADRLFPTHPQQPCSLKPPSFHPKGRNGPCNRVCKTVDYRSLHSCKFQCLKNLELLFPIVGRRGRKWSFKALPMCPVLYLSDPTAPLWCGCEFSHRLMRTLRDRLVQGRWGRFPSGPL